MKNEMRKIRMDAPTIILHWTFVISLTISMITGFRIAADDPGSQWMLFLDSLLLQGLVTYIHIISATVLSLVAVAYIYYLFKTGLSSRLSLDRQRLQAISSGDRRASMAAINVVLFWVVYAMMAMAAVTGMLMYWDTAVAPMTVRSVHEIIAWCTLAYLFLHILLQLLAGGVPQLLKIITPQAAYGTSFLIAATIGTATAGTLYVIDRWSINDLHVTKVSAATPQIDGNFSDPIWTKIKPTTVHTSRGANESGEEVSVQIKAVHDGEYFYAMFEWPDKTRSHKHLPLVKTEKGWQVLHSEFHIQDEDDYYEDKFGVMFSRVADMSGAGTANMGPKPLAGKPSPKGGRGLHYTSDGSIVDVWHWKSVRSGSDLMQQIDDNYFGPPMEPKPSKSRYTGGYTQDPKTGGGFKMNWEKFSTDTIKPLRLPADPAMLEKFRSVDLSPDKGDNIALYMAMAETVPYSEELDNYPIGTVMPSVLVDAPYAGDRGDVTAISQWQDGKWRMEVKRKLDTGSKYDIALKQDQPTYMWVAVFDHAQTRHSQHIHPVRIVVE